LVDWNLLREMVSGAKTLILDRMEAGKLKGFASEGVTPSVLAENT